MKKYITTVITFSVLVVAMASCFDLKEEIYSSIPLDSFFKTEQDVLMNAGRAYVKLQRFPEEQMLWSLMENSSDEVVIPTRYDGEWKDQGRWENIHQHAVNPVNKINAQAWDMVFGGVSACNEIIYETEQSPIEFEGKTRILAEIHVLRAFFYYWAIDNWANIPFNVDFTDKALPPQKGRAFVYDFIVKDIRDNLPELADEPTAEYYGRVTKGMAHLLLAKLYMNSEVWGQGAHWEDAVKECDSIITTGHYQLETNYFDNFTIHNEGSKENIFVIPYNSILTTDRFYWSTLSLNSSSMASFGMISVPWDGFVVDPTFFQKFDAADMRIKSFLFGQQYDQTGTAMVIDDEPFIYTPTIADYTHRGKWEGARFAKYEYQTGLNYDVTDMENDFALFRYADVIYTKLEAKWRLGQTGEYINDPDVQKLRTRAGMTPYAEGDITANELLDELGREFALEGHRRQDQVRFGTYGDAGWNKAAGSNDYIFPIPTIVMGANPNLVQNP